MFWTEKKLCKYFGHREDHQYKHFNRALGKYIRSKEEFVDLLEKGNYVPSEIGHQSAEMTREKRYKKYDGLSDEKMKFISDIKSISDKKGNIEISDRFVNGLKEQGVPINFDIEKLPKHYREEGGFYER